MFRKIIKPAIAVFMLAVMLLSMSAASFALPINVNIMDNYFYNSSGEAVSSPVAYRPVQVKGSKDLSVGISFSPSDMLYYDDYLYVLDEGNNCIHLLDSEYNVALTIDSIKDSKEYSIPDIDKYVYDEEGNRTVDTALARANKYAFNHPHGFYISKDGLIYVADTENRRVVVIDSTGTCHNVIQSVRVSVLGKDFVFKPMNIVSDSTGDIRVIAYGVNRGFLTLDSTGSFVEFFGLPTTTIAPQDWILVLFADTDTLKTRVERVTAEYSNMVIDSKGFVYAVTADTSTGAAPLRKLSTDGSDVLNQEGATLSAIGDIDGSSVLVDVAVNEENNTYTVLDSFHGRFFTYDSIGRFLYMGGGAGSQYGRFKDPVAIVTKGDALVVADAETGTLSIFELTDYAKTVNAAVTATNSGMNEEATELWTQVTKYFSNMYIAYIAMGDIQMLYSSSLEDEDPAKTECLNKAMEYYRLGVNKNGYSDAFKQLRNGEVSKYFTVLFISAIVLIAGIVALIFIRKYRKARIDEKRKAGLL